MSLNRNTKNEAVYIPSDCEKIQKIVAKHGYELTIEECNRLWGAYSNNSAANWLSLDYYSDEAVWKALNRVAYFEGQEITEEIIMVVSK